MAFVSTDWSIIIVLLLLLSDNALLTSSKNAGTSNLSKKGKNGSQRVTLSANNPFLNKYTTTADYRDNPFFTVSPTFVAYLPENTNAHNSGNNPFLTEISKPDNDPDYIHNPFLTSTKETNNDNLSTSDFTHSLGQNENRSNITDVYNDKRKEPSTILEGQPSQPFKVSSIDLFNKQSTRTKSDVKCEEYGNQFMGTAEIQYLVGANTQPVKVQNERCTVPDRLITGGTATLPGEFPHMVGLGKILEDGSFMLYCGGTLISPSWVLTAAHCTHGPNGGPTLAKIGIHDINNNRTGNNIAIKRAIRHPSYKPPAMYADIALIELQRTITFSTLIKPACLYQLYDTVPMKVWVSGWGVTEYAGEQSNKLQKAQLNIIDNIACSMRHNTSIAVPYGVTPSMICAGDPHGGWIRDTCQGDSGGPLQVPHPRYLCLSQVIGITSFGEGCAIVNSPGVYTRVSHYLNWIEDIVWPNNE